MTTNILTPVDVLRSCVAESDGDLVAAFFACEHIFSNWDESQHPRGEGGKFTKVSHGTSKKDESNKDVNNIKEIDTPKELGTSWTEPIKIASNKVSEFSKYIKENVSAIIDHIPGSKFVRNTAKNLVRTLTSRYGRIGALAIIGAGLTIHYRKEIFTAIKTVADKATPIVTKTLPHIKAGVAATVPIIKAGAAAAIPIASNIWSIIIPPTLSILAILAAYEVYKGLRSGSLQRGIRLKLQQMKSKRIKEGSTQFSIEENTPEELDEETKRKLGNEFIEALKKTTEDIQSKEVTNKEIDAEFSIDWDEEEILSQTISIDTIRSARVAEIARLVIAKREV